ncbi:MAG: hypothetical protein KIT84_25350 [Labilithrix sp.]|nr:hypothetical protein [Labilithrix sp.]MCW5814378.1 hypothetical protein [Labilithrix sp.]
MRALVAFGLFAAGCAARPPAPPEPGVVQTMRHETPPPPAPERCLAPEVRARVADCSVTRVLTHAEVLAALDASDRAVVARPPKAEEPASRAKSSNELAEERRRQLIPMDLVPEQIEAVSALTSWVCAHPEDDVITFRLARLHFEHRRFEEASFFFARVAEHAPASEDIAPAAFVRWLETVSILGVDFGRVSCFDEVDEKVRPARERLCAFDLVALHPDRTQACTMIGRVNYDVDRLRLIEGTN